jgi:GNAT superfamily N-acetyltransferase
VPQVSLIRPLEREDLPHVAALYELVMRSGSRTPPPLLAPYFERMFLNHPWADPELPSLVYATPDGTILGFLGSLVRRMRFDGEPIRLSCSECFITDPTARRRGIGALLLRRFLKGPQDVTMTDSGEVPVRHMWENLGGSTALVNSIGWTRFLRPFRFAGDYLLQRLGRPGLQPYARPVTSLADAVARKLPGTRLRLDQPPTRDEELTSQALLEHLPSFTHGLRFHPDYDEDFLRWLFAEMAALKSRGTPVRRLVRDSAGRPLGWYVAFLPPGGVGQVLQVVTSERDVDAVVDHLFHHARRTGTAVLRGRLEALLFESTWRHRCYLRHSPRMLVHSRDPEITRAILLGHGILTRMEGAWWMGQLVEPFR